MDQVEVKLSVIGSAVKRMEQHLANAAKPQATTTSGVITAEDQVVAAALHATGSDDSDTSASILIKQHTAVASTSTASTQQSLSYDDIGNGPVLDSKAYTALEGTLAQLQISPDAVVKLQDAPIGRGGFAKVYKVQFNNTVCAAKVVKLSELTPRQLQKVYLRFCKELYILSKLQDERIVKLHGCTSTVEEMSLLIDTEHRTYNFVCVSAAAAADTLHNSICIVVAYEEY
eukprot:12334-Heterococcus_DN1.PRE.2